MNLDVALAVAVPVIGLAMIGEAWLGRRQGRSVYRWPSLVSDLSCGVASLVGKGIVGVSAVAAYAWFEGRFGWLDLDVASPWVWLAGFLMMDCTLYWRHRACHRVGLFWALHAVHHQSPDLNIGTANRVPWLQDLQVLPFVFAPALVGFPTPVFAAHLAVATLWALWTHTRVIGRLGPLERIIITPSHHRVHHGCDGAYVDKNYGAVLVLWDHVFGTFEPERAEPVYGTRHFTDELCAFRSNARPFQELFRRAATAPTWLGAVETLFRPPGWDPRSRREHAPELVEPAPPVDVPGIPWGQLGALVVCALIAAVPLYLGDLPLVAELGVAAVIFAALSALSRRRPVEARPALRGSGAG